ncbi:unnamed protein product, partial [Effrenium voratum]
PKLNLQRTDLTAMRPVGFTSRDLRCGLLEPVAELEMERQPHISEEMQAELENEKGQSLSVEVPHVCRQLWPILHVLAWTLFRIKVNVSMILDPDSPGGKVFYGDHLPIYLRMADGILRPAICSLSLVPFFLPFANWESQLRQASLAAWFSVAVLSSLLELLALAVPEDLQAPGAFDGVLMTFSWVSRLGLGLVTQVSLPGLRGRCFSFAWVGWVGIYGFRALARMVQLDLPAALDHFFTGLTWSLLAALTGISALALGREAVTKRRMLEGRQGRDEACARNAARSARLLWLGSALTILDAVNLVLIEGCHEIGFFTLDNALVLSTILVLLFALEVSDQVLELGYMARICGKRIAFPGKVNRSAQHCVVSFPGKYAEEWDDAVRRVQLEAGACSLACVFLTDRTSGLGVHVENPDQPGTCWCRALYGQVKAEAYRSIVDEPDSVSAEDLRFKEMDAVAMGQVFLKRDGQSDEQWKADKQAAETAAQRKCEENGGRAPWGCRWFHEWQANVHQAAALKQTLHVFYFEGKVGRGKLPWQDLSNETSVQRAREDSGLGASQAAEVAYLNKCGFHFVEHDVAEFYNFMVECRNNI